MSELVEGDRVEHERYGLGTVEARAETATGYAARSPPRVRVRWDEPDGADDGTLKGWRPPYQAREDFDATLTDELGDDYHAEHKNGHATTFYAEVSR